MSSDEIQALHHKLDLLASQVESLAGQMVSLAARVASLETSVSGVMKASQWAVRAVILLAGILLGSGAVSATQLLQAFTASGASSATGR